MKARSTTSEEPATAVSAAATRPPVQDSAVAICQPRPRQASSTDPTMWRVLVSNTKCSGDDKQDAESVTCRQNVVEDNAETAMNTAICPPHGPRLPHVEYSKGQEGERVGEGIEGCRQQHQPLARDLVDHDRAGIFNSARVGGNRCRPATGHKDY